MKKSTLSILAGALFMAAASISCSGKDAAANENPEGKKKLPPSSHETNISIRYYDMDTVMAKYHLCQDLNEALTLKSSYIEKEVAAKQKELETKDKALQRKQQEIESKAKNGGYLTQQSYESDMKALQDDATEFQRQYQQAQQYIANLQQEAVILGNQQYQQFIDSVEVFLKDYNEVNKFDAIFILKPGEHFNGALDITNEIVEGLNARYTKVAN